jgi:serine/tyrosine/threonine adenylyltransferase
MAITSPAEPVFVNRFTRELPADKITDNFCRQVQGAAYSRIKPSKTHKPELLAFNEALAHELGLQSLLADKDSLAMLLSGNALLEGMDPFAMAYAGHQFGNWAGQLGDGRAINLGEIRTPQNTYATLQLKGAGATPFSRHADGRAVLRSSLREYLCSEAMFHLGVPTTRALSLVTTGDSVVRDMFYDGNPVAEPGAIVCRVSPSFIRFGNFELPASRGDHKLLRQLLDFVVSTDREDLAERLRSTQAKAMLTSVYLDWFQHVCRLTQTMVVHWMRVGFVHGVMNTDNMSVLGLTIDYGPYGWIDDYNPDWTPNTTDAANKRYRFGNQPAIARWNLYQLANAIYPIVEDAGALETILNSLPSEYDKEYAEMMSRKLGFEDPANCPRRLIDDLEKLLRVRATDMTLFFRILSEFDAEDPLCNLHELLRPAFYGAEQFSPSDILKYQQWEAHYRLSLRNETDTQGRRKLRMNAVNPAYVPRNYLAQQVIDAAQAGDCKPFKSLLDILEKPYEQTASADLMAGAKRPDWAKHKAGCSMLSCSS